MHLVLEVRILHIDHVTRCERSVAVAALTFQDTSNLREIMLVKGKAAARTIGQDTRIWFSRVSQGWMEDHLTTVRKTRNFRGYGFGTSDDRRVVGFGGFFFQRKLRFCLVRHASPLLN